MNWVRLDLDEISLTFELVSNSIVDVKGFKPVSVKASGHEETHYTAGLLCYADGTKLSPLLILKGKTLPKGKLSRRNFVHIHPKG